MRDARSLYVSDAEMDYVYKHICMTVAGPADSVLYRPRPALHCVRFVYAALLERKNVSIIPERKKLSTLTSDDAVTCQNIPGSLRISDVGSKVITNIVRAEEGEPGDEAIADLDWTALS